MNAAEIAAKLTKAQREAVLAINPAYRNWADDMPTAAPLYPAYEAGLASRCWDGPGLHYQLTSAGLAVRAILQAKEPTDDA